MSDDNIVPFPEPLEWRPRSEAQRLAHLALLSLIIPEGRLDISASFAALVVAFEGYLSGAKDAEPHPI